MLCIARVLCQTLSGRIRIHLQPEKRWYAPEMVRGNLLLWAGGRCLLQPPLPILSLSVSLSLSLSLSTPLSASVLLSLLLAKTGIHGHVQGAWRAWRAWRARAGAVSVGFVASEKNEGPAGVLLEDQKVSSRLARAWPRDTHTHTHIRSMGCGLHLLHLTCTQHNNVVENGQPVCVTLDHPRPPAHLCSTAKWACTLSMSRFLGGLISLPCRNMAHTFLMLCAEIDGLESTGRQRRHIS